MADVFTSDKRSEVMRLVRPQKNKSTELAAIKFFKDNNIIGWRRNYKLFGKPDFVFSSIRLAVFIDGCFWHGHNCRNITPQNNKEYWERKILRNKKRDRLVTRTLILKGWTVIRIKECEFKASKKLKRISNNIVRQILNSY
ncbi:MAG TPA: very short patch repair endonuclease [Flavipsychrobacter sp.]|nr:very short patch repair endonuclease [Flavipsychrobacter sp.]